MALVADPEETIGRRFVAVSLVLAGLVTVVLCFGLPAWASQVAQTRIPAGAVTVGRVSLQPQPGWEELSDDESSEPARHLVKDGVLLTVATVPADAGPDPGGYLEALLDEFTVVADYDPVPFTSRSGDSGLIVLASGIDESGVFAVLVSRDGRDVALMPTVGDPVAVSALTPEIGDMVTAARFRRAQ